MVMSVVGGLKHPIAVGIGGVFFCIGSKLYMVGYSDTSLRVGSARYKRGGGIKWIGFFTSLYSSISLAGNMLGWW